jgi:hypothetical protein
LQTGFIALDEAHPKLGLRGRTPIDVFTDRLGVVDHESHPNAAGLGNHPV